MKTYKVEVDNYNNIRWYNEAGEYHREDGPAIECADGYKAWYLNNKRHRVDGPAVECTNGTKCWYQHGKRHREDGPAIEYADGYKYWYQNGQCHREDGPAVEIANGDKYWYLNGQLLTEATFNKKMKKKSACEGKVVEIDGKKYKLQEV